MDRRGERIHQSGLERSWSMRWGEADGERAGSREGRGELSGDLVSTRPAQEAPEDEAKELSLGAIWQDEKGEARDTTG